MMIKSISLECHLDYYVQWSHLSIITKEHFEPYEGGVCVHAGVLVAVCAC